MIDANVCQCKRPCEFLWFLDWLLEQLLHTRLFSLSALIFSMFSIILLNCSINIDFYKINKKKNLSLFLINFHKLVNAWMFKRNIHKLCCFLHNRVRLLHLKTTKGECLNNNFPLSISRKYFSYFCTIKKHD